MDEFAAVYSVSNDNQDVTESVRLVCSNSRADYSPSTDDGGGGEGSATSSVRLRRTRLLIDELKRRLRQKDGTLCQVYASLDQLGARLTASDDDRRRRATHTDEQRRELERQNHDWQERCAQMERRLEQSGAMVAEQEVSRLTDRLAAQTTHFERTIADKEQEISDIQSRMEFQKQTSVKDRRRLENDLQRTNESLKRAENETEAKTLELAAMEKQYTTALVRDSRLQYEAVRLSEDVKLANREVVRLKDECGRLLEQNVALSQMLRNANDGACFVKLCEPAVNASCQPSAVRRVRFASEVDVKVLSSADKTDTNGRMSAAERNTLERPTDARQCQTTDESLAQRSIILPYNNLPMSEKHVNTGDVYKSINPKPVKDASLTSSEDNQSAINSFRHENIGKTTVDFEPPPQAPSNNAPLASITTDNGRMLAFYDPSQQRAIDILKVLDQTPPPRLPPITDTTNAVDAAAPPMTDAAPPTMSAATSIAEAPKESMCTAPQDTCEASKPMCMAPRDTFEVPSMTGKPAPTTSIAIHIVTRSVADDGRHADATAGVEHNHHQSGCTGEQSTSQCSHATDPTTIGETDETKRSDSTDNTTAPF